MAQKWITEDELNYMKMGGKVIYAQEGATAQGGNDQVMQLIQAYAQTAGADPKELMAQLQQMSPEQQQQAIQSMAQELQNGAEGQEQNQSPQEEQAEMQGGGQDQMMQQIAQAIQQGADPQQVMAALVKQGVPEEQAGQMIQAISQQMQGAPQMAKGGRVYSEDGNTIVNFDSAYTKLTAPIEKNKNLKNRGTVDGENTKYPFKQQQGGTAFYDEFRQDAVQKMIQGGNLHTYEGKNIKAKNGAKIKAPLGTIVGKSIPESTALNRVLQPVEFQKTNPIVEGYMKRFGADRKTAEKAIAINQAAQAANKPATISQGYKETSKQKADRIKKNEAYVKANSNFAMLDDNGNIVPKTDQYSISGQMLPGAADARAAKKNKTTLGILGAGAAAPFVLPEVAALSSAATPLLNAPLLAGLTPNNLIAGYSAYEGAHNLPHFTESYKKAWENPSAANVGNAATQTGIQALNFLPAFHNLKALTVAEDLAGKETLAALAKHKAKHIGLEEASQQLSEENSHKAKGGYIKPYFYNITIPGSEFMGGRKDYIMDANYEQGGNIRNPHFYNMNISGPEFMGRRKDYLMDANYAVGGTVPEGYHRMPSGALMPNALHKQNGNVGQQDLGRFMTGNNSIQGGQGARYDIGGFVQGGMLVGDKQYYPYGGYVEYDKPIANPENVGDYIAAFGEEGTNIGDVQAWAQKFQGGGTPYENYFTNSFKNLDPNKTGYDFSSIKGKSPYLTAANPIESQTSQKNLLTSTNNAVADAQKAQAKQEIQPMTPKGATPLPTTNVAQTATMPSTNSNTITSTPDVRNYKNAVAAGVTNIDEFMRYKRTGYPNPPQMQQYGGYTRIAQWGDTAQELTQPTTVNANWMDVSSTPPSPIVGQKQFNVDPNQANTQQNVAAAKAVTSGPPAGLSKGLSSMNPVSMGLNAAGGAMDATANLMASLGKEGSKAQAFGQGAANAMNIAGMATAPFKDIPVVGQALDAVGKTLGFLIGGPLAAKQAAIRKEEEDKAEKLKTYYEKTTPATTATQGQYMAKYGKNVSNYKQRIMDDIYNDFDKYMKK